jgi:hypothetical protein
MLYVRFTGGSDYFKLPRETYEPDAEPVAVAAAAAAADGDGDGDGDTKAP